MICCRPLGIDSQEERDKAVVKRYTDRTNEEIARALEREDEKQGNA